MNKYEIAYNFFNEIIAPIEPSEIPNEVREVIEEILNQALLQREKPLFTESGLQVFEYLQSTDSKNLKASDIAQGMDISSRKVNGAIRKLVSDGFVQKFGQNPVIYSLTEKGKKFNLDEYKETMNNEKNN